MLALAVVCHGIVAIYTAVGALVIVLVNTDGWKRFWFGITVGFGVDPAVGVLDRAVPAPTTTT